MKNCQKAFGELKLLLVSALFLTHPIADEMFILDTDTSDSGFGGVLSQIQNAETNSNFEIRLLLSKNSSL